MSLAPSLSPDSALAGLCSADNLSPRSGLTEPRESREASPVHSAARNLDQDTGDRDQYYQKVRSCLCLVELNSVFCSSTTTPRLQFVIKTLSLEFTKAPRPRLDVSVFKIKILQVEFALKLGYPEDLTRKALGKVGLAACNVGFI